MRTPVRPLPVLLLVALAALAWPPAAARAQDAAPPAAAAPAADDPAAIAPEVLRLELLPLRKDALAERADAWMARLEAAVAALAQGELAARSLAGAERSEQLRRNADLGQARDRVLERTRVVLDALAAKGGDVTEQRAYLAAVSGTTLDVTDADALLTAVEAWLRSPEGGLRIAKNAALFVVVVVGAWIVASLASGVVRRALDRFGRTSTLLRQFLVRGVRRTILVVGLVAGVSVLGVPMGPFMAIIGAAGLVVGLALQGTLSNFASGLLILLYRPFDVGDVVTAAGVTGKVESLSLMTTGLVTADNQSIVVPNNAVWGGVITNVSGRPTRRVDMVFGISYGDDLDRARGILEAVVRKHPLVLADPAPVIQVSQLADSSVNFVVRPWAKTPDYWTVLWEITAEVKRRFDAEGVTIPFPQREVWVRNEARPA